MQIIDYATSARNSHDAVQTIGFFDGVHRGHDFLLQRVKAEAEARGQRSMVITFREHPRTVVSPGTRMPLLTTLDEKLALLQQKGIDCVALLDFNRAMSQMSARQFMQQILSERLGGRTLIVGYDHHFGRPQEGEGFEQYCQYGKEVGLDVIAATECSADLHISSTAVRKALAMGHVSEAALMLGRPYSLTGSVTRGQSIGRSIGFPTANIRVNHPDKILPRQAAYAVRAHVGNECMAGMLYIGNRPTIEGIDENRVEVHLLDFDRDIYDCNVTVEFLHHLRDEQHFDSIDALRLQLTKDCARVRHLVCSTT